MLQEIVVERLTIEGAPMASNGKVTIEKIPLNKIKLNKNSRLNIDPDELDGLMQSIKQEGLLQPIGVVKSGSSGYEICYGNRRYLAVSKLGLASIPAIVHEKQKETDVDIKNLTENIQRRNISLAEAGRYIDLLEQQGLSRSEAAVRMGVSRTYVDACLTAFNEIPKEFRDDIEIKVMGGRDNASRTAPGKISVNVARQILSQHKQGKINRSQVKKLLSDAKSNSKFNQNKISEYSKALALGKKDYLSAVVDEKYVVLKFFITESHRRDLEKKYVDDGPFSTLHSLMYAILRGEKSVPIKLRREGLNSSY